jgi:GAF domain-containing protein
MMRATDEKQYVQEVCEIIVRNCGYQMAWVGYARQDEGRSVEPVAWAGLEEGYLQTVRITWADTERGRGPSGTAIRTGRAVVCNNFLNDPSFGPWRQEATKRGYASSISLPLMTEGEAFGALMIYSDQLMLIDEFQNHFNMLWIRENKAGVSDRLAIETLRFVADECKKHIHPHKVIQESSHTDQAVCSEKAMNS